MIYASCNEGISMASRAPPTQLPEILTAKDVAQILGVSTFQVYRLVRRGQIPCLWIGDTYRFTRSWIEQWLKEQQTKPL